MATRLNVGSIVDNSL